MPTKNHRRTLIRAAALSLALTGTATSAYAVTQSFSFIVSSVPATAINCVASYPSGQTSFVAPVASGTMIAACTVEPQGWSGLLTLGGPDSDFFVLSGSNIVVKATITLTDARTYNLTITATP